MCAAKKNGLKMTTTNSHCAKEIEAIYAVVSIDENDGMEGIMFVQDNPNQPPRPLLCYSPSELPSLRLEAKEASEKLNRLAIIIKLTVKK